MEETTAEKRESVPTKRNASEVLKDGEEFTELIKRTGKLGDGICFVKRVVVFVPLKKPAADGQQPGVGDVIKGRITKTVGTSAYAVVLNIVEKAQRAAEPAPKEKQENQDTTPPSLPPPVQPPQRKYKWQH